MPFEVPSSWVWCKLHDIIQITNGRSQKYVENVNGKYPIYGSGGIIGKAVDYLCEAGSTIIGRKGTINNPLFVEERFWNIDTAFGMKPMYAISDLYFFYFCQYFDFSKLDKSTAVPSLTQSAIGEVFIPIPPINEQKRITDGISYWLGFIDTLESNLINLQLAIKQTKSKILNLAIHGKLVPQDPTDEPAAELLKRINPKAEITCDNGHYQKLPKGWCLCDLSSLCKIKGGKRIPRGRTFSKERTPHIYIRVSDMKNNTIITTDLKYIDDDVYQTIKNYTISSSDLYLTIAGTVGHVGIVPKQFDGMNLTENAAKLTGIICDKKYLLYSLLSSTAQEHFKSRFHQVAQPKLSIETASSTMIYLPPLKEQHRIVAKIEEIFAQLYAIEASL